MPQPGHFELGLQGLALLRLWLVGEDRQVRDRIQELAAAVNALAAQPTDDGYVAPEFAIQAGYSQWAESYDRLANPIIQLEEPVVWGMLAELKPGQAVDVACGTGRHLAWLEQLGHLAVGVDLTHAMLTRARAAGRPRLCAADMRMLPFASAPFDLAVCSLPLTHVADLQGPVAELARVVRRGGRVIVSDVHPFAVIVGTQAGYRASGRLAFVRNYVHLHGAYLRAFAAAGLTVRGCEEPVVGEAEIGLIHAQHVGSAPGAPSLDAYRQAFLGLPAVLVWDLERS